MVGSLVKQVAIFAAGVCAFSGAVGASIWAVTRLPRAPSAGAIWLPSAQRRAAK